ncbi:MAG: lipopolysaccharide biosynthesis protein [Planctomycetota bacterium]
MSLSQKAAKLGKLSSIYAVSDIVLYGLGFALMGVFTYYLKPEQMGIVRLAGQIMLPLGLFMQLGLFAAMKSWYFRTDEAERGSLVRTIFLGQLGQGVVFVVMLAAAGIWLAGVFLPKLPLDAHQTYLLWLMILACCMFRALIQLGRNLAVLQERAFTAVGITFLQRLSDMSLGIVAVIGLRWLGMGRQLTVMVAMALAATVALTVGLRASAGGQFRWSLLRSAERTGISFLPHQLSGLMAPAIIAWLVNWLDSTATLGIYAIGVAFAKLIEMPVTAITNAAFPMIAGLMKEGTPEAKRQHTKLYTLVIIGLCAIALGLALFSPVALRILSKEYHAAMSVVTILVFAYLWQGIYRLVSQPIFYLGGGLWLAIATISSVVAALLLSLLLIPSYGMQGAAWSMFGCFLTRFLVALGVSQKLYPVRWEAGRIVRGLILAAAVAAIDAWLTDTVTMPLVGVIAVKILLFVMMLALIPVVGVISEAEFAQGKRMVTGKLRSLFGRGR